MKHLLQKKWLPSSFISLDFQFYLNLGLSDSLVPCQVFKIFRVCVVHEGSFPSLSQHILKMEVHSMFSSRGVASGLLIWFLKDDSDSCLQIGLIVCEGVGQNLEKGGHLRDHWGGLSEQWRPLSLTWGDGRGWTQKRTSSIGVVEASVQMMLAAGLRRWTEKMLQEDHPLSWPYS